jgi:hypothetical protein
MKALLFSRLPEFRTIMDGFNLTQSSLKQNLATMSFEQIELASSFLDIFTKSSLRPAILLLYGDLIEEQARKLSVDAGRRLNRREMAATVAPLHSFYLNYVGLDRFRRLGITFLFNVETKQFHYNGKSWDELIKKYPDAQESIEAKKRIESLKEKLESSEKKK